MSRKLVAAGTAGIAALALLTGTPGLDRAAAEPAGASRAAPQFRADFNGDGFGDLAIGAPRARVAGRDSAGAVYVLYGSAAGLRTAGRQVWSLASPGIAQDPEVWDQFGFSLGAGDFDGDGFADLAVGMPLKEVEGVGGAGAVHVLYGSRSGLTAVKSQVLVENGFGVHGDLGVAHHFGENLAVGNFGNGDADDLAISVVGQSVYVLYGNVEGTGNLSYGQHLTPEIIGFPSSTEANGGFGWSLAAGDLGRSAHDDLVIGSPYDTVDGVTSAGSFMVLYGSAPALDTRGKQLWTRSSPGVADAPGERDLFGDELTIGDFGHGRTGDLAIGIPGDDPSGVINAGSVQVLYGTPAGLRASGAQLWTQRTKGVKGVAESGDRFGYSLAAANLGRSGQADLAVGSIGDRHRGGGVNVLYGTNAGLRAAGDRYLSQNTRGIAGVAESGDQFGDDLTTTHLGPTGYADLVVGASFENPVPDLDSHEGIVHVIPGSAGGPRATASRFFTQRQLDPANATAAEFGRALAG